MLEYIDSSFKNWAVQKHVRLKLMVLNSPLVVRFGLF